MEQINDQRKVSIIVPCYNVDKYISDFIESILQQSYKNIEVIFINDGSTDNTESIINNYMDNLKVNMEVRYVYQKNKGLGGAINTGLKIFTGEYLCWADPDDYLEPDSIEKRVGYLNEHLDIAVVTSDAEIRENSVYGNVIGHIADWYGENNYNPHQFLLLLNSNSIFCPGCHMVRAESFFTVNPHRDIFEARRGQNWQMLLPLYYSFKRGFLNESLYRYVIYPSSMSRGDDTVLKKVNRQKEHLEIVFNTLDRIKMSNKERKKYKSIFKNFTNNNLFNIFLEDKNFTKACYYFATLLGTEYANRSKISQLINIIKH